MFLGKAVLFVVVCFAALVTAASAQTAPGPSGGEAEERAAAANLAAFRATLDASPPSLVGSAVSALLRGDSRNGENLGRAIVSGPRALLFTGAVAVPRHPAARGIRSIHGRFLPIPGLQWRTRAPIDRHAMLTVGPSLVIGRRPTFMPEGVREGLRSGRTFGFGVQMRITLGQPAATLRAPVTPSTGALLTSRVKALLSVPR